MSIAIANADGTGPVIPAVPGDRKQAVVKVTFDSSYPTNGEVITPASVGLDQIDAIICSALTSGGRFVVPVLASGVWKLKVMLRAAIATSGDAETIDAAASAELANTTNISTETVFALVIGK